MDCGIYEKCRPGKPHYNVRFRRVELLTGAWSRRRRAKDVPDVTLVIRHYVWQLVLQRFERQNRAVCKFAIIGDRKVQVCVPDNNGRGN